MTLAVRDPSIPDSPLACWDPRWKLAAVVVFTAGTVALRHPGSAAVALLVAVALNALGRVPPAVVAGRAGLLLLAVLPLILFVPLIQPADGPGWDLGWFHVSIPGLLSALAISLRVTAVGLFALVLTRTAPLARTLAAAHALGVPGVLVQVAQLAYRYTFVLAAEARRVRVALRTRGFRLRTTPHTYRTVGHAVGSLLVRSADRADRVADAMRCRGFDGAYHTLAAFHTSPADALSFLLAAAGTIAGVTLDRLL